MFFIITIHTLQHGGVLESVAVGSGQYICAKLLFSIVNSGVDIFALISGFVGYRDEIRSPSYNKFIELWSRVVFYSIVIAIIFCFIFSVNIGIKDIIKLFTPVTSNSYWYFTSYFFVICLAPVLNRFVKKVVEKNIHGTLLVGYVSLLLSHRLTGLFSIVLLLYLYYLGAYFRKAEIGTNIKISKCMTWVVLIILLNCICTIIFESRVSTSIGGLFLRYDSPTLIINAVFWLLTFKQIRINKYRTMHALRIVSPSIFSAYLINDNPYMRNYYITDRFVGIVNLPVAIFILEIVLFGVFFLVFSICIDFCREWLFKRLHIYQGIHYCKKNIDVFLGKLEITILRIIR